MCVDCSRSGGPKRRTGAAEGRPTRHEKKKSESSFLNGGIFQPLLLTNGRIFSGADFAPSRLPAHSSSSAVALGGRKQRKKCGHNFVVIVSHLLTERRHKKSLDEYSDERASDAAADRRTDGETKLTLSGNGDNGFIRSHFGKLVSRRMIHWNRLCNYEHPCAAFLLRLLRRPVRSSARSERKNQVVIT